MKSNIAWASVVAIFVGAVAYVPALHFAEQKQEVVYQRVPVFVTMSPDNMSPDGDLNNEPIGPGTSDDIQPADTTIEEPVALLTKELRLGDVDPEVRILQEYLNAKGFLVAESGPGSPGQETTRFGAGTHDALVRFQEANAPLILEPFGLSEGTGILGELTRRLINS